MSTHTGEVLHVNGLLDFGVLCAGTLTLKSIVRAAKKAVILWLFLEEIMVYSQSDLCSLGLVFVEA